MVIIGLTLAATAASAEPLRLGDMDLDLVTADMLGSSLVPRVAQSRDRGSFDEDDNAGADDVDLAATLSALRVSNDDADNAVRDSDVLVLRGSDPSDTGVAVLKSAAVAGKEAGASDAGTTASVVVPDRDTPLESAAGDASGGVQVAGTGRVAGGSHAASVVRGTGANHDLPAHRAVSAR